MVTHPDFAVIPDHRAFEVCQRQHRVLYDNCVKKVQWIMGWEPREATVWMTTKNPMLGNVSPVGMIAHGRGERLMRFVLEAESVVDGKREW